MNATYIRIFSLLSRKLSAVLLSSLSSGTVIAFLFMTPINMQEPNVYYFGFFEIIIFYIFYTLPIYILLAIPFSIFIDTYKKTTNLSYYKKSLLYSIAGIIASVIYYSLMGGSASDDWEKLLFFAVCGLISANLFLVFLNIINVIRK